MGERELPLAVRFHAAPPALEDLAMASPAGGRVAYRLLSLPLYLVGEPPRLLREAG